MVEPRAGKILAGLDKWITLAKPVPVSARFFVLPFMNRHDNVELQDIPKQKSCGTGSLVFGEHMFLRTNKSKSMCMQKIMHLS